MLRCENSSDTIWNQKQKYSVSLAKPTSHETPSPASKTGKWARTRMATAKFPQSQHSNVLAICDVARHNSGDAICIPAPVGKRFLVVGAIIPHAGYDRE